MKIIPILPRLFIADVRAILSYESIRYTRWWVPNFATYHICGYNITLVPSCACGCLSASPELYRCHRVSLETDPEPAMWPWWMWVKQTNGMVILFIKSGHSKKVVSWYMCMNIYPFPQCCIANVGVIVLTASESAMYGPSVKWGYILKFFRDE